MSNASIFSRLTCPNNRLNGDVAMVDLFRELLHSLVRVFVSVRIDVCLYSALGWEHERHGH